MRLPLLLSLVASAAFAQAASGVRCLDDDCETLVRTAGRAPLFSFASPTAFIGYKAYAGLPASDGCYPAASVTGTKGEALTFTRATTRFCPTDGTTNEATGVMCSSGEVCIRSLSGKRGIDIFRSGTNLALQSEGFDDAAWTKAAAAPATTPTVTANSVACPPGISGSAERIQVTACPSNSYSVVYQATASKTNSLWMKGNASTPTVSICSSVAGGSCSQKVLTTEWVRYSLNNAATGTMVVGCDNEPGLAGSGNTGAADFFACGAQAETGAYLTPYVATAGASATRNAEVATFGGVTVPVVVSMAADVAFGTGWTGQAASYNVILAARTGAADYILLGNSSGFAGVEANPGSKVSRDVVALSAFPRWWAYQTASALGAGHGATAFATTTTSAYTPAPLSVGHWNSTLHIDGLVSNICVDPDPARCR